MCLLLTNQSALFQHCVAMILRNMFMTSAPGVQRTCKTNSSEILSILPAPALVSMYLLSWCKTDSVNEILSSVIWRSQ